MPAWTPRTCMHTIFFGATSKSCRCEHTSLCHSAHCVSLAVAYTTSPSLASASSLSRPAPPCSSGVHEHMARAALSRRRRMQNVCPMCASDFASTASLFGSSALGVHTGFERVFALPFCVKICVTSTMRLPGAQKGVHGRTQTVKLRF